MSRGFPEKVNWTVLSPSVARLFVTEYEKLTLVVPAGIVKRVNKELVPSSSDLYTSYERLDVDGFESFTAIGTLPTSS